MCDDKNLDNVEFISRYKRLTPEEKELIRSSNIIKSFPKGTILLNAGQIAKETYLVLKGCVRNFHLAEGEDTTTEFFTESDLIVPVSYTDKKPSTYFVECLEDCTVSVGKEERTQAFLAKYPQYVDLCLSITRDLMSRKQESFDDYRTLLPEMRYQRLLEKRPDLIQRVPQYHIASYLGIKPQSLSRIRKRLTLKQL